MEMARLFFVGWLVRELREVLRHRCPVHRILKDWGITGHYGLILDDNTSK